MSSSKAAGADRLGDSSDELDILRPAKPAPRDWRIRAAIREDIPRLVRLRELCYMLPLPEVFRWPPEAFEGQLSTFPEGQLVVETEGRVVAASTTCLLKLDGQLPGWRRLNVGVWGAIAGHRPDGDGMYLADIVVHPLYRRRHYALHLCEAVQEMVRKRKLRNLFVVARMPGYRHHAGKLGAEEYARRVAAGKLTDFSLTFWLKAGFTMQEVLPEFYPDSDSCGFAVMMEWMPKGSPTPFTRRLTDEDTMTGTLARPGRP
jgi:ribosomal protein S18 acetylase RimI-like enzyme